MLVGVNVSKSFSVAVHLREAKYPADQPILFRFRYFPAICKFYTRNEDK